MKRWAIVIALIAACGTTAAQACDEKKQARFLDEVLRLSVEQVPTSIILKQVQTMDFVFCLTADDIIELRRLGVSDEVLEALIDTALVDSEDDYDGSFTLRITTGYYSPWYRFPSAWGSYYDPFPSWYSCYYYPFHYYSPHGWYGSCDNTYYDYDYDYGCRYGERYNRDWRDRRPHQDPVTDPSRYRVTERRLRSVPAAPPEIVDRTPRHGVVPRQPDASRDEPRRVVRTQFDRQRLRTVRTPYRAERVTRGPAVRREAAPEHEAGRSVRDAGRPNRTQERAPGSVEPAQDAGGGSSSTPAVAPRVRREPQTPRTVNPATRQRTERAVAPSVPRPRHDAPPRVAPRTGVAPSRQAPPAVRPSERRNKS